MWTPVAVAVILSFFLCFFFVVSLVAFVAYHPSYFWCFGKPFTAEVQPHFRSAHSTGQQQSFNSELQYDSREKHGWTVAPPAGEYGRVSVHTDGRSASDVFTHTNPYATHTASAPAPVSAPVGNYYAQPTGSQNNSSEHASAYKSYEMVPANNDDISMHLGGKYTAVFCILCSM